RPLLLPLAHVSSKRSAVKRHTGVQRTIQSLEEFCPARTKVRREHPLPLLVGIEIQVVVLAFRALLAPHRDQVPRVPLVQPALGVIRPPALRVRDPSAQQEFLTRTYELVEIGE